MVDFNNCVDSIRRNGGFRTNLHDSSYYRTYKTQDSKPLQVRISNHGTHLRTWIGRNYDPSASINICVVFSKDGSTDSDVTIKRQIMRSFAVMQYVYNCSILDENNILEINKSITQIYKQKGFTDPLAGTPKHSTFQPLESK